MRTRLRSLGVPTVAARTIHSAALKQLIYFWPTVFGGRVPELMTAKAGFIGEAINRAGLSGELRATSRELMRDIASEIEWAKVSQVAPEDFALTEFICVSKQPHQQIVREGLDLMKEELG